jgi:hypothetical protein
VSRVKAPSIRGKGEDRRIPKRSMERVKVNYLFRGQRAELRGLPLSELNIQRCCNLGEAFEKATVDIAKAQKRTKLSLSSRVLRILQGRCVFLRNG